MVRISRATEASNAPIPIRIVTDRAERQFSMPGPYNSIEIPGCRIRHLNIGTPQLYGIRIVADGEEYRLSDIDNIRDLDNVDAILIYDGFVYGAGYPYGPYSAPYSGGLIAIPGYTYRPQMIRGGEFVQSGKSFIYPGQVIPYPYPGGPIPPPPFGPYGGYNGFGPEFD